MRMTRHLLQVLALATTSILGLNAFKQMVGPVSRVIGPARSPWTIRMNAAPAPATTISPSQAPPSRMGARTWDREGWLRGFENARTEETYELEGSLPQDMEDGTFFRNGYAKFDINGQEIAHPFDGDGMVTAITFKEGRAFFRNRYVRTAGFKAEAQAGRILYRGMFGTQKAGGMLANMFDFRRKNVANTNVLYWGKRLLALWEGGLPHVLDPLTLETLKTSQLGGVLGPNENFGAHPRSDPSTNRVVALSQEVGPVTSKATFYEFDKDFRLVQKRIESIPGFSFIHDFVVTENYYVIVQAPMTVNLLPFVLGMQGVAEGIVYQDDKPARVYLVPRKLSEPMSTFELDTHFAFHYANGYDDPNTGEVVFDTVRVNKLYLTDKDKKAQGPIWRSVDYEKEVPKSTLWRYRINPKTGTVVKEQFQDYYIEFPSINPAFSCKRYKYVFAAAGRHDVDVNGGTPTPVCSVAKINIEDKTKDVWTAEPHEFISEINFVPRKGGSSSRAEDDGYLMTLLLNGHTGKSEVLIFDAKDVVKGPVSRLPLRSNIPHSLHGMYAVGLAPDGDDILRKFKVSYALEKNSWNEISSKMNYIA